MSGDYASLSRAPRARFVRIVPALPRSGTAAPRPGP
jgi:hypothetical protein